MTPEQILSHNREAWDRYVDKADRWTCPVSPETVARARRGEISIVLTPTKPVPTDWFPDLGGCRTLCLAFGGGQQAPMLAAAGAEVTVFDNSPKQLQQDKAVGQREGLRLSTVQGDMADLSVFGDESFDHPSRS